MSTDTREALAAQTYIDFYGDEKPERRKRDRTGEDARVDHLFNGFDNVIENADDYTKGYVRAMRKEFAELIAALATQPAQPNAQGEAVAWIRQDWSGSGQRTLSFEGPPDPKPLRDEVVNPIWTPLYASAPAAQPSAQGEAVAKVLQTGRDLVDAYRARYKKPSTSGLRSDAPLMREFAEFNGALVALASAPAAPAQAVPPKVAKTLIAALRDGNFNATNIEPAELNAAADWVLGIAPAAPAQAKRIISFACMSPSYCQEFGCDKMCEMTVQPMTKEKTDE